MHLITIFFIAVGLAMDAFAVSVVMGGTYKKFHLAHILRAAGSFGLFQAIMPLIGYLAAFSIKSFVEDFDHWIAFVLLAAVGGKMIYESFKLKPQEDRPDFSSITVLLVLSIATSIDALAVGFSMSFLQMPIAEAVTIIGIVTFMLSFVGAIIGNRFTHFFENKIEIIGGLILIGIGTKILIQHLFY